MNVEAANDGRVRRELRSFLTATQYFTRVPVPAWVGHGAAQLNRAARYFPLVGIGIGAIGAGALWVGSLIFPPLLAVIVSTIATIALTGAFHEDGLADTIDGLGGSASRERALEIMKDSRIGTFGALALVLVLLLKIVALASMPIREAMLALIAGHALSRSCAILLMAGLSYSRTDDSTRAKPVTESVDFTDMIIACCCGMTPLLLMPPRAAIGLATALITLFLLRRWFKRRLGGYTGDTLGATQQCCEAVFYLGLVASWKSF